MEELKEARIRGASGGQQGIERKVVEDVTEGSGNLTMMWTAMVTDDSLLAASACKRKWINGVAQRYMSADEFYHSLRNCYHLDTANILTLIRPGVGLGHADCLKKG